MEETKRFNSNYREAFTSESDKQLFHGWCLYANYIPLKFDISIHEIIKLLNGSLLVTHNQIWAGIVKYNNKMDFGDNLDIIKKYQGLMIPHVSYIAEFTEEEAVNFINMRIGYNYTKKALEEEEFSLMKKNEEQKQKEKIEDLNNKKILMLSNKTSLLQKLVLNSLFFKR